MIKNRRKEKQQDKVNAAVGGTALTAVGAGAPISAFATGIGIAGGAWLVPVITGGACLVFGIGLIHAAITE